MKVQSIQSVNYQTNVNKQNNTAFKGALSNTIKGAWQKGINWTKGAVMGVAVTASTIAPQASKAEAGAIFNKTEGAIDRYTPTFVLATKDAMKTLTSFYPTNVKNALGIVEEDIYGNFGSSAIKEKHYITRIFSGTDLRKTFNKTTHVITTPFKPTSSKFVEEARKINIGTPEESFKTKLKLVGEGAEETVIPLDMPTEGATRFYKSVTEEIAYEPGKLPGDIETNSIFRVSPEGVMQKIGTLP